MSVNAIVDVKDINGLVSSANEIMHIQDNTEKVSSALNQRLLMLVESAECEMGISRGLLVEAELEENMRLVELQMASAELLAAEAEFVAAVSSGNPLAICDASEKVSAATSKVAIATEKYNDAVEHTNNMRRRVDLVEQALNRSNTLLEDVKRTCQYHISNMKDISSNASENLHKAHEILEYYFSITTSIQRDEFKKWRKKEDENKDDKPVMPPVIIDRLNPSESIMMTMLGELDATDSNFNSFVKRLRGMVQTGERDRAELIVRRNGSGRLAEEIVKQSFAPYGMVLDQARKELEVSFTKVDFKIINMNVAIILNRGLMVPQGGSLGIEVKTGTKSYLLAQKSHLETQIQGHTDCDVSCVLVSRDIHDLTKTAEQELRESVSNSGSRVLAMLPMKETIDDVCIKYILDYGLEGDSNV